MIDLNEVSAQEIGRRLRLAREHAGIRQDEAAKVIDTSRPTLVSIEQGQRRVRIQELQKLAHHYGVSVNALLGSGKAKLSPGAMSPRYLKG